MDYEAFAERAKSAFDDCSEMKRMLWNMQSVVGAVPDMVRKNERLDKEKAELKAENAALKVELDDWKGNAEGFEPDAYMRLPLDADGVPVRLREIVWYKGSDIGIFKDLPLRVAGFAAVPSKEGINVVTRQYPDKAICPRFLTHNPPEPPDSWEKIEEDAEKTACRYFYGVEEKDIVSCIGCKHSNQATGRPCRVSMNIELMKRAKKLAGIEEEAQR